MAKKPDGKKKTDKPNVATTTKGEKPEVKVRGAKPDFSPRVKPTVDYAANNAKYTNEAYDRASLSYSAFANGILGVYGFMSPSGKVVVEVANNGGEKPAIYVTHSTATNIFADDDWFLVHQCLRYQNVRQIGTASLFRWQEAIHSFLRPFVADLYKPKAAEVVQPFVLTKEQVKTAAKAAAELQEKKLADLKAQNLSVALYHMEKNLITVQQAATGKLGYCDLSNESGKLIALFGQEGNDHIVSVAFIGEDHVLRSAGVHVGDKVFGGYITHGFDKQHSINMMPEKFAMRTALANYFRSQMEARGIKFRTGQTAKNQANYLKAA
jgi:hypothetical protein